MGHRWMRSLIAAALTGFAGPALPAVFEPGPGMGTLADAIAAANGSPGPHEIVLGPGIYALDLSRGPVVISADVTIRGAGSRATVIDGNLGGRMFSIRAPFTEWGVGVSVTFEGVTLQGVDGEVIENGWDWWNRVVVRNSVIRNAWYGLYTRGTALVEGSTFVDVGVAFDLTDGDQGLIVNSTFTGHAACTWAVAVGETAFPDVAFSTVVIERGLQTRPCVGAAHGHSTVVDLLMGNVTGTMVVGAAGLCGYWPVPGLGNRDDDGTCFTGVASFLPLGPLQDNGGPTDTFRPAPGSAALDAISAVDCAQVADQRGAARPASGGCDVGAVEVAPYEFDAASGNVAAGGSLSTGPLRGLAAGDPIATTVTHPDGGSISIREQPGAGAFAIVGQAVQIEVAPLPAPPGQIRIAFDIDTGAIPAGQTAASLVVTRDGAVVGECSAGADPCVAVRKDMAWGVRLEVLTSRASLWTVEPGQPVPVPVPAISIADASAPEGDAGASDLLFTVVLSEPTTVPVSVAYATADGSALAGQDYLATAGTLTFAPGEVSRTLAVPVLGDTLYESDEQLLVQLSSPVGGTLAVATAAGTIVNDDAPPRPAISIGDVRVVEGDAGATQALFPVTLSFASPLEIRVDWSTADGSAAAGSDYLSASGTLVLAPGQTAAEVAIAVLGDTADEPDETFFVQLSNPVNGIIGDGLGQGTIADDDPTPPPPGAGDALVRGEGSFGSGHGARFHLRASREAGVTRGELEFEDHAARVELHGRVTSIACAGNRASLEGTFRRHGRNAPFQAEAVDGGPGGADSLTVRWAGGSAGGAIHGRLKVLCGP